MAEESLVGAVLSPVTFIVSAGPGVGPFPWSAPDGEIWSLVGDRQVAEVGTYLHSVTDVFLGTSTCSG